MLNSNKNLTKNLDINLLPVRDRNLSIDACIVMICQLNGLHISLQEIAKIAPTSDSPREMNVIFALFDKFGFRAIPLEGPISELPGVPRPNVVVLKGELPSYALLLDIDSKNVTLMDPLAPPSETDSKGCKRLTLDEFGQRWTGDAFQITPNPLEIEKYKVAIQKASSPLEKWRRRLGLAAPYPPKLGFLGIFLLLIVTNYYKLFGWADWQPALHLPLSFLVVVSCWLHLFGRSCSSCFQIQIKTGDGPYAMLGAIFYSALFIISLFPNTGPLVQWGVCGAFGGHVYLMSLLFREKSPCYPCAAAALSSLFLMVQIALSHPRPEMLLVYLGFSLLGGVAFQQGMKKHQAWGKDLRRTTTFRLAMDGFQKLAKNDPHSEKVQLLTYTKAGCLPCILFKSITGPALKEEFGESLVFIEEDMSKRFYVPTPTFLIHGKISALVYGIGGPELFDVLTKAIRKAKTFNPDLSGLWVIDDAAHAKTKAIQKQEELHKKQQEEARLDAEFQSPLQPQIDRDRATFGEATAPITIVSYNDFQCHYGNLGYQTLQHVLESYSGKVKWLHKHLPLSFHSLAMPAAKYFEAIALQDFKKAYRFCDQVFQNQKTFGSEGVAYLESIAQALGVDLAQLKQDLVSDKVKERIAADMAEASKFQFNGTPGFLIDGISVRGALPYEVFQNIIDRKLRSEGLHG